MEMGNVMEGGQWCNACSDMVNPASEGENKCPLCGTEFTEVMGDLRDHSEAIDLRSTSVFSLYGPILLGLMNALTPALATIASSSSSSSSNGSREEGEEAEQDMEHGELVVRRRRRTSTSLMLIFRHLHDRMVQSESDQNNAENDRNSSRSSSSNHSNNNLNLSMIVIDPFNEEALILRSPSQMNSGRSAPVESPVGSLGDFLEGPGFGLFLQRLAQNERNRYVNNVSPPAQKAAIEAMPMVSIEEKMQCIICLEDAEIGSEVKEMPCAHKFHSDCIISWLKLHSSCPVCRFQMPSDDSRIETNVEGTQNSDQVMAREERMRFGRRNWLSILQPFDYFLPSP